MKVKYVLLLLLLVGIFNIAFGLQADNVTIYQSIPDPSLGISSHHISLTETVYFVIYNNGSEPVYIHNLTHDWGRSYVQGIESSFIGNDKIGYEDITQNTSVRYYHHHGQNNRYVDVTLSTPIEVEPGNYVEFYYTFTKKQGTYDTGLNTEVLVYFNDSSSKIRNKTIAAQPSPVILTDFRVDNPNYSTAEGADYNISSSTIYNFTFRITNFANLIGYMYGGTPNVTFYRGNITIVFPSSFYNVIQISNNTVCVGNICNCSVEFGLNTPPQICVIQATTSTNGGDFIIYANASENELLPSWTFPMNSVSELFIKVYHCPEPEIYHASVSPREIYFGESINVIANVSSHPPITNVWLQIDGKNVSLYLKSGNLLNGSYEINYFPTKEGTISLTLLAKNKCGKISSYNLGTILVKPPITPPSPEACKNISTIGLVDMPGVISVDKLNALLNLDYYCTKNILGLWQYDLYVEVTYLNNTLVSLNGTSMFYGIAPGRTSSDILYGIPGTGIISPRYGGGGGGGTTLLSAPNPIAEKAKPLYGQYSSAINFERYVVLQINQRYELVKVTLGVWA